MSIYRSIRRISTGTAAVDGAGVHLVRVIGSSDVNDYDPFLMLDAFDSVRPADYMAGFPWHPHRGIETVTYLMEGEMEHGDSNGNRGIIRSGEAQWMTAGSGIIHQEMPHAAPRMLGAQLWLNLPQKDKMAAPAYAAITKEEIPPVEDGDAVVRILSGAYKSRQGGFQSRYIPVTYLDVEISPNGSWEFTGVPSDTLFVYLVLGSASFPTEQTPGQLLAAKHAVLFDAGDVLSVKAGGEGVRMLLLSAPALHEPVAWGGPVVMNTEEELRQAFAELEDGTFLREGSAGRQ